MCAQLLVNVTVSFACTQAVAGGLPIFAVCEMLHISHGTRFLAVKLIDHFMDKHVVMDYHIKLVALTCLLVAGMLGSYNLDKSLVKRTEFSASLHMLYV